MPRRPQSATDLPGIPDQCVGAERDHLNRLREEAVIALKEEQGYQRLLQAARKVSDLKTTAYVEAWHEANGQLTFFDSEEIT